MDDVRLNMDDALDAFEDDVAPEKPTATPASDESEAKRIAQEQSDALDRAYAKRAETGGQKEKKPSSKKVKPEDVISNRQPFKLHKKAILYTLLGFGVISYITMFYLVPSIRLKKGEEDLGVDSAGFVEVPVFTEGKEGEIDYGDFDYALPANALAQDGGAVFPGAEGNALGASVSGGIDRNANPGRTAGNSDNSNGVGENGGFNSTRGGSGTPDDINPVSFPSYSSGGGYVDEEELKARRSAIAISIDGSPDASGAGSMGGGDLFSNGLQLPDTMNPADFAQDMMASMGGVGTMMGGGATPGVAAPASEDTFATQNNQAGKQEFFSGGGDVENGYYITNEHLASGSVIPALLRFEINSDLPGEVVAMVTENVYDALTGKNLLVPQGSTLIATYSSDVSYQQKRVQIAWRYLRRPDGFVLPLGNMPGVDDKGASGATGRVNNHMFQYLLAMGYASIYSIIVGELDSLQGDNEGVNNLINTNQSVIDQALGQMLNRTLDIQPTIKVKAGTRINVFINQDVWVPALEAPEVVGPYVRQ